jgi:FkbM family methyltransferase
MGRQSADTQTEVRHPEPQRVPPDSSREGEWERVADFEVRLNDRPNFCILYKDIFCNRIYHFEACRPDPLILDCGSNIGMSILYFKHVYPAARIIAFEPDPTVLPYLRENLARNGLTDVKIIDAALCGSERRQTLYSDGKYSSTLVAPEPGASVVECTPYTVPCVRLHDYLTEPVDFLKMNIEGVEWEVLADSEDRLHSVSAMVVEYHHAPRLPRTLHRILELLDRQGFEYLINDFDAETNPHSQPPFRLHRNSRYYLLIYAQRKEAPAYA